MSFDLKLTNGDISFKSDGTAETVLKEEKLIQDLLKIIFTPVGSHKKQPWYGSALLSNAVGRADDFSIVNRDIQASISNAIKNLQALQGFQEKDGQFIAPEEFLFSVEDIYATKDPNDPRAIVVKIRVLTRSGRIIEESLVINN